VGQQTKEPQSLPAQAEVLFSVASVRSVVSVFFAARGEFRKSQRNAATGGPALAAQAETRIPGPEPRIPSLNHARLHRY